MAKQEREKGLRRGTALMVEKVQEVPITSKIREPASSPAPVATSAFLEEVSESEVVPAAGAKRGLSRAEIKRQRVEAAREKRTRL
jgi:hypothetical protein